MGDVGARVTMYYMELELHIRKKKEEGRCGQLLFE
jgi:hypothetical protein